MSHCDACNPCVHRTSTLAEPSALPTAAARGGGRRGHHVQERPVLDLLEQALRHHASLVGVVARSRGSHAERLGPILLRRHRVGAAELHARHQARVEAVQRVL